MATTKQTAKPVSKKPAVKKAAPIKTAKKVANAKAAPKVKPTFKKAVVKSKPIPKSASKPTKPIKKSLPVKAIKVVAKKPVPKKAIPVKAVKKEMPSQKKAIQYKNVKLVANKLLSKTSSNINKVAALAKTDIKADPIKQETKKSSTTALSKAKDIKVPAPKPVVLPKITATTSRKYEPDFTKSVLDQAPPENNGPTHRYSDVELNEFRELIQRKLETAKKELGYLQGLITRKDEMGGGDDTDNRYMTMEDGSLSMEREQLSQMASRQITFIDHLEKATMRIENKTYGICRVTGKLIDKARLRAVPHATLSIEAKMGIAK